MTIIGLVITGLIFPYYAFHWGIKPCDEPGAGANCGDADFGGLVFIVIGVPLVAVGLICLLLSAVLQLTAAKTAFGWRLLRLVALAASVIVIYFSLTLLWSAFLAS